MKSIACSFRNAGWFSLYEPMDETFKIKAEGEKEIGCKIQADNLKIQESNICWLKVQIEEEPAIPAILIVLLGGNRWMISELYPGKT